MEGNQSPPTERIDFLDEISKSMGASHITPQAMSHANFLVNEELL